MSKVKIVILGGYGAFGSLISSELAKSENVTIAGRNREKGQNFANSINADFSLCDAKEGKSLRGTIKGADIVINASGPFYPNDYSIPIICIDNGCHYIDLADGREYVKNFPQLDTMAKTQGVFASTGASTSPAVTYSMISGIPALQEIQSIKIFMNAGNKNEAGISTFASILSYAGQPVQVWNDGHWDEMMGWGSSEKFDFPPPVGRRFVQLCNVPDLELFPNLFEANQVIFKAGVELSILNIGLSILSQVKKHFPIIDLPSITGFLVITSRIFKNFWLIFR